MGVTWLRWAEFCADFSILRYNSCAVIEAFRVIVKTVKDVWGDMFMLVLMNLFTLLCTVVVIPGPPAWAALYAMCNRIANEYAVSWDGYFEAFRKYFGKSWLYFVLLAVVSALIVVNFFWYGQVFGDQVWVAWVRGAWLAVGFFWLVVNFYVWPFLMEQEDKRWRVALRNSALIAAANPLFTLTLLIVLGIVLGVSLVLTPVFVLMGLAIFAMTGSEAVVNRVTVYRKRLAAEADATSQAGKA